MRWLLSLWFLPIGFLVLWLTLASNDWSLGCTSFRATCTTPSSVSTRTCSA